MRQAAARRSAMLHENDLFQINYFDDFFLLFDVVTQKYD